VLIVKQKENSGEAKITFLLIGLNNSKIYFLWWRNSEDSENNKNILE
jgi:hypothetical protein